MELLQRLTSPGPKRILALDGGGIRGALTLGYLQRIEDVLRRQHSDNPAFTLSDYFDLIGGTSTGSIIASCLAIGMRVEEIKNKYFELGGKIFARKYDWWNIFEIKDFLKARYDGQPLEEELQKVFGDITLESNQIKTGLCIVCKRADTNSVWPIINHPNGKFYNSSLGTNKDILLWKAVRASAAAPTYFLPQVIEVGGKLPVAAFVDGGVSMANNPALQLLMVANLKGFPFKWEMGADKLLLTSVGTGTSRLNRLPEDIDHNNLIKWAQQIPDMLMQDASWQNQLILQWLSNSPTRWHVDMEIGDMKGDLLSIKGDQDGLLHYLRYNFYLEMEKINTLKPNGKTFSKAEVQSLCQMSNGDSRFDLYDIGLSAAATEVKEDHFPERFIINGKEGGN